MFQGLSIQAGYARATGVNLLAAGLNYPPMYGGSGIYLHDGRIAELYISPSKSSKLIIQDVPKSRVKLSAIKCNNNSHVCFDIQKMWKKINLKEISAHSTISTRWSSKRRNAQYSAWRYEFTHPSPFEFPRFGNKSQTLQLQRWILLQVSCSFARETCVSRSEIYVSFILWCANLWRHNDRRSFLRADSVSKQR